MEEAFPDAGWEVKKRYDAKLQGAPTGYRAGKVKFKNRLVAECQKKAPVLLPKHSDLEVRSDSLFGTTPIIESLLESATPSRKHRKFRMPCGAFWNTISAFSAELGTTISSIYSTARKS